MALDGKLFPYLGTGLTVLVDTLDAKLKIRVPNVVHGELITRSNRLAASPGCSYRFFNAVTSWTS